MAETWKRAVGFVVAATALTGAASAQARTADLELVSSSGPDTVAIGSSATYSAVFRNNGPDPIVNKESYMYINGLTSLRVTSLTTTNGTCPDVGTNPSCTFGDIPSGGTLTVSAVMTPTDSTPAGVTDDFQFIGYLTSTDASEPNPPGDTNNRKAFNVTIGAPGSGQPDTTPPTISDQRLPRGLARSVLGTGGANLVFTLSEPATVAATWFRYRPGVRARGARRCRLVATRVRPRLLRLRRDGRRRYVACQARSVFGIQNLGARAAGQNTVPVPATVGSRRLSNGSYRIGLIARDAASNNSRIAYTNRFTIG